MLVIILEDAHESLNGEVKTANRPVVSSENEYDSWFWGDEKLQTRAQKSTNFLKMNGSDSNTLLRLFRWGCLAFALYTEYSHQD